MRNFPTTALAAMAFLSIAATAPTTALGDEAVTTPLLKAALEGTDGMEANIAVVEAGPGFETERHLHPGHVFVYVIEGAIQIDVEGQEPVTISAGEAAYETPNHPMVGRNVSATEGARFVVFQVVQAGEPLTVAQPH
jgi:quercetin dioxygenase-like cupin family protein